MYVSTALVSPKYTPQSEPCNICVSSFQIRCQRYRQMRAWRTAVPFCQDRCTHQSCQRQNCTHSTTCTRQPFAAIICIHETLPHGAVIQHNNTQLTCSEWQPDLAEDWKTYAQREWNSTASRSLTAHQSRATLCRSTEQSYVFLCPVSIHRQLISSVNQTFADIILAVKK